MARALPLALLLALGIALWWASDHRARGPAAPASPAASGPGPASDPASGGEPARDVASPPISRVPDPNRDARARAPGSPLHARSPDPEAWIDASGRPSRDLVRASLEGTLRERFPTHKLSPDEVERLTDAAVELRAAQEELRVLPATPEHAERRRALRDAVGEATATFVELLDMTPAEFTAGAEPGGGVDAFDPEEAVPEPELLGGPTR